MSDLGEFYDRLNRLVMPEAELKLRGYPRPGNAPGFINTSSGATHKSVLALDCEMVTTNRGNEVAALTVVDHRCQPVYETMVKPEGHVLNYNTPYSGLTEPDLRGVTTTLRDVHAKLLALMGPSTILVGHGMHNDLMALRLLHGHIVDTNHLYPDPRGWPNANPLILLIQRHLPPLNEGGHKCRKDAVATMMLARLKCGLRARP